MCGRFSLAWEEWHNVAGKLGLDRRCEVSTSYKPQRNIAPTDAHFIVTAEYERRRAQAARWAWSIGGREIIGRRASASMREPRP